MPNILTKNCPKNNMIYLHIEEYIAWIINKCSSLVLAEPFEEFNSELAQKRLSPTLWDE